MADNVENRIIIRTSRCNENYILNKLGFAKSFSLNNLIPIEKVTKEKMKQLWGSHSDCYDYNMRNTRDRIQIIFITEGSHPKKFISKLIKELDFDWNFIYDEYPKGIGNIEIRNHEITYLNYQTYYEDEITRTIEEYGTSNSLIHNANHISTMPFSDSTIFRRNPPEFNPHQYDLLCSLRLRIHEYEAENLDRECCEDIFRQNLTNIRENECLLNEHEEDMIIRMSQLARATNR